jgi:hypothetical protein
MYVEISLDLLVLKEQLLIEASVSNFAYANIVSHYTNHVLSIQLLYVKMRV